MGPQCGSTSDIEKHTCCVPWYVTKKNGYRVYLMVREPISRAMSLFAHYAHYGGQLSEEQFFRKQYKHRLPGFYSWPMGRYQRAAGSIEGVIHLERADKELSGILGKSIRLPHENRSHIQCCEQKAETKEIIRNWAWCDWDYGYVPDADRLDFLRKLPSGRTAEVGVHRGVHALEMWDVLAPCEMHLIDLWTEDTDWMSGATDRSIVEKQFGGHRDVVLHRDDSLSGATRFPDEHFQVVYLDADHTRPAIDRDLQTWWPKVAPGGVLCGHDYCVTQNIQVKPAVDAFAKERGLVVESTDAELPEFLIRKR